MTTRTLAGQNTPPILVMPDVGNPRVQPGQPCRRLTPLDF